MSGLRVVATIIVVAGAGLAIWVASSGMRQGRTGSGKEDSPDNAYDYQATDVVVTQIGPDGTLQYELRAKQITQQPNDGQLSAKDLVMYKDLPGNRAGETNRWTLRADSADLPESGDAITMKGKVHAEGRPQNSNSLISVAADEINYNLRAQEIVSAMPVVVRQGNTRMSAQSLRFNLRTRHIEAVDLKVESDNGTSAPK